MYVHNILCDRVDRHPCVMNKCLVKSARVKVYACVIILFHITYNIFYISICNIYTCMYTFSELSENIFSLR